MELWDLYTKDKVKSGIQMYRGEKVPEGCYRLVVCACIFNSKGEMLIQQRQTFKSGWSGKWDISCGGCPIAGETSRDAIKRELSEELGVILDFEDLLPKITLTLGNAFIDVYLIEKDIELSSLSLQECEVRDARWATMEEILGLIDTDDFIPYNKGFVESLFFFRNHSKTTTKPDDTTPTK